MATARRSTVVRGFLGRLLKNLNVGVLWSALGGEDRRVEGGLHLEYEVSERGGGGSGGGGDEEAAKSGGSGHGNPSGRMQPHTHTHTRTRAQIISQ